jgi:hypothetical protein
MANYFRTTTEFYKKIRSLEDEKSKANCFGVISGLEELSKQKALMAVTNKRVIYFLVNSKTTRGFAVEFGNILSVTLFNNDTEIILKTNSGVTAHLKHISRGNPAEVMREINEQRERGLV